MLDVSGLSVKSPSAFGTSLKNVHMTVHKGEVLGIGGVAGNGQDELLLALSGEIPTASDAVKLGGKPVGHLGPNARRKLGLLTIIQKFDVRTPGAGNAARALSGGNLQKFVIGREVLQRPEVLVVNQPTWGVDASAAAAIRQSLLDLAANGTALVVISQDLDELMEISDHFAALNEGRLSGSRVASELTIDEIGLMMGGAHGMEVAHV